MVVRLGTKMAPPWYHGGSKGPFFIVVRDVTGPFNRRVCWLGWMPMLWQAGLGTKALLDAVHMRGVGRFKGKDEPNWYRGGIMVVRLGTKMTLPWYHGGTKGPFFIVVRDVTGRFNRQVCWLDWMPMLWLAGLGAKALLDAVHMRGVGRWKGKDEPNWYRGDIMVVLLGTKMAPPWYHGGSKGPFFIVVRDVTGPFNRRVCWLGWMPMLWQAGLGTKALLDAVHMRGVGRFKGKDEPPWYRGDIMVVRLGAKMAPPWYHDGPSWYQGGLIPCRPSTTRILHLTFRTWPS